MYIDFEHLSNQGKTEFKKALIDCGYPPLTSIPFSTEIPLDGHYIMEGLTISDVLTFTPKAGKRIAGSKCYIRLSIGSQAGNIPVFAGFGPDAISTGWNDGTLITNFVTFFYDGVQCLYDVSYCQNMGPKAAIVTSWVNYQQTDQLLLTYNGKISPSPVPDPADFIVYHNGNVVRVTNVGVDNVNLVINLETSIPQGDSVYVTYTPSEDKPLTDFNGWSLDGFDSLNFVFPTF